MSIKVQVSNTASNTEEFIEEKNETKKASDHIWTIFEEMKFQLPELIEPIGDLRINKSVSVQTETISGTKNRKKSVVHEDFSTSVQLCALESYKSVKLDKGE